VGAPSELALNLGLAGLVWLVLGHARRRWRFGYLGAGLGLSGLLFELWAVGVGQAQLYACAVGTYLLITAYLEWRRGISGDIKPRLELAGLAALLGTSLAQSVGALNGDLDRHLYVVLFLGESLALAWLGAALRWRRTFSAGLLGAACAAVILIAEPLRAVDTWYVLASAGLVLIAVVLLLERRRQHLERWLGSWRQAVEAWD
jgi:hypothetical protein